MTQVSHGKRVSLNVLYRKGKQEDAPFIKALGNQNYSLARIENDLEQYPSAVALNKRGLLGFVLSEELSSDVLLVYSLGVNENYRCSSLGRKLLELLESRAMTEGYYGIVVSGFVQNALIGCDSDALTFAGYKKIYDTGRSRLLTKSLN